VLREAADRLLDGGASCLVTVVGGSSTGKTRACWELARYLDQQQPGQWRVWHPYDPTRPEAALAELERAGAHTVVWLNEAQHYLMPTDPGLGERLAAGLRTLLTNEGRAPVIVLATLWPAYWDTLTVRPGAGQPDSHAQARDLLARGTKVTVGETFTPAELAGLRRGGIDARLRYAAEHAVGGRITQYLAGAPALEDRYRTAPPAVRAILHVAMDALRLGHSPALPYALLEQAAPGYLTEHEWDHPGGDQHDWDDDWLEQALAYATRRLTGAQGTFARIRPQHGRPAPAGGPYYRLADYLEQTGRRERVGVYPPDSLWQAFAATVTDPLLLDTLGAQAERRGRYQHAIWLYRQAADRGNTSSLLALALVCGNAGHEAEAEAMMVQAAEHGDTSGLLKLAWWRERDGDLDAAEAVYRQAAEHGDIGALLWVARRREQAGDIDGAKALLVQAVDGSDTHEPRGLAELRTLVELRELDELEQNEQAEPGEHAQLQEQATLREQTELLEQAELLEEAGDTAGAEALAVQCADRKNTIALLSLARLRDEAGDTAGAEALAVQAADRGDTSVFVTLARWRELGGDNAGAEVVYRQAADRGDTNALRALARRRAQAGDLAGAEALNVQAADHGDAKAVPVLARRLELRGDTVGADHARRFGLTGSGGIATGLDFDSSIPGV
jgi:hypothetical protein